MSAATARTALLGPRRALRRKSHTLVVGASPFLAAEPSTTAIKLREVAYPSLFAAA
jgi:hypothetical protein